MTENSPECGERVLAAFQFSIPTFSFLILTKLPVSQVSLSGTLLSCSDYQFLGYLYERTEDLISIPGTERPASEIGCAGRG